MHQSELDDLIAAHEAWLDDATRGRRLELTGVNLRGRRLAGRLWRARLIDVDASACHAAGADLAYSVLQRVRFTRANLAGACLSGAELADVDFAHAVLDDAELYVQDVRDLRFDHAQMRRVSLMYADLERARFDGADLRGANCLRADFTSCSFVGATLRGVNLTRASLRYVDLRGADVTDARLLRAVLTKAAVHGVRGVPATVARCDIETVDVSPAGDGRALREGSWLLAQWAPLNPLDGVAVDVGRVVDFGAAPGEKFDVGVAVQLNGAVTVYFIPDIARDAGEWWETALEGAARPRDALTARRRTALLARYVVTPDAARAGQDARLTREGRETAPWMQDEGARLFYVAPEAFARYVAEVEALLGTPEETPAAWSLGRLRGCGFVQVLRDRVLPALTPADREALGLALAASDGRAALD